MKGVSIKDKTVLITGANRGIGRSLAAQAVRLGAKKVYAAARNISSLGDLLKLDSAKVVAVQLDVTKADEIQAAAAKAKDVQVLINNAGVARMGGFTGPADLAFARQELEVNYLGAYQMAAAFAPILKQNGGGAIVNVVSVAGLTNFPFAATYSASKAAAHSLTQGLRAELAAQGTLVCGVYPGPIDTDMAADVPMEKASPDHVAKEVFEAMAKGLEEIFPDPYSVEFGKKWIQSAKNVEREMTASLQQNQV